MRLKFNFVLCLVFALSSSAFAQSFRLEDLTTENAENILEEIAGVTSHTTVSGASPLGEEFGFEVGIVGSYGQTPTINRIVERSNGDSGYKYLPSAGILGRVGIAQWVVLEGVYFPDTDLGDYNVKIASLAAQVNLLREKPFNLAVKAFYTNSIISYEQKEEQTTLGVDLENDVKGAQAILSQNYAIFEPYIGAGYIENDGKITVSGETTIFDDSFGDRASADGKGSSALYLGGVEMDLLFGNLGIEAAHAYDNMKYSAKVSVGF